MFENKYRYSCRSKSAWKV